jgi:hypothetical protein
MNDYAFLALQLAKVLALTLSVWALTYAFFLITP